MTAEGFEQAVSKEEKENELNGLLQSAAFLPRCLCCCSAPGRRSCHISVDFFQAESSVLTSYFLGVRWKFLKTKSRRQKGTYLPTYHTQSARGETRRDYRVFPICFRAKRKSKRELKRFRKNLTLLIFQVMTKMEMAFEKDDCFSRNLFEN